MVDVIGFFMLHGSLVYLQPSCLYIPPFFFPAFFRLMAQFSYNLSLDWELPKKIEPTAKPLKEGVKDMLVKHHLFSWDL